MREQVATNIKLFTAGTAIIMAPRNGLTGFDPKKYAAAAGTPINDPWKRYEAWRYNGPFTRWNRLKGSFPGFGIAAGAFVVYLAYEAVFVKDEHGHGEIGQGKDHHGIAV